MKMIIMAFKAFFFFFSLLGLQLFASANSPSNKETSAEGWQQLPRGNYGKKFSWDDPALMETLGITKDEPSVYYHTDPRNLTLDKRADDGNLYEAVAPSQCATCPGAPEVWTVDMLTTKYLLSQMLVGPSELQDNCLFYTGRAKDRNPPRLSEWAQDAACVNGWTTIWSMWASPRNPKAGESRDFYAEKGDNGWLEPIWNDGDKIFTYFENMSRAMALSCRGETYVMSDTPGTLPNKFIWGTVEYPALRYNADWTTLDSSILPLVNSITAFQTTDDIEETGLLDPYSIPLYLPNDDFGPNTEWPQWPGSPELTPPASYKRSANRWNNTRKRDGCTSSTPEQGNDDWFGSGMAGGVASPLAG